jgi:type IV pilus assembly protein PilO
MELQDLPWYGQLAVFALIGGVLFGIFYFVHYSNVQDNINGIVQQRLEVEKSIRRLERAEKQLKRLEEERDKNLKILEELKGILPERKESAEIIKKIQAIASSAKLEINHLTPKNFVPKPVYYEWPISVSVLANYHQLAIFFDQVSRMKRLFNIDSLTINPLPRMTSDFTVRASFTATSYVYKETPGQ